jgi:putative component of toxin-antitoxin plasmid stabilization module
MSYSICFSTSVASCCVKRLFCYYAWNGSLQRSLSNLKIHCQMQAVDVGNCVDVHTVHWWVTEPRLGHKKPWLQFLGCRWYYSHGLPWSWDHHQLNKQHSTLKTLKQRFRKVQKHEKNILPQHNNARPHTLWTTKRQLRSWISPSYHTCHTAQTWHHTTSTFSKNVGRPLYDSREEVEKSVRTEMKKQKCAVLLWHLSET